MTATTTATKTVKIKPTVTCWCGCGGDTKSRFVPGHDARFHGTAKKVARGQLDADTEADRLPHDDAREEFAHHVELELPKVEARAIADAAKAARKAKLAEEKAVAKAEKEALEAVQKDHKDEADAGK